MDACMLSERKPGTRWHALQFKDDIHVTVDLLSFPIGCLGFRRRNVHRRKSTNGEGVGAGKGRRW